MECPHPNSFISSSRLVSINIIYSIQVDLYHVSLSRLCVWQLDYHAEVSATKSLYRIKVVVVVRVASQHLVPQSRLFGAKPC